MEKTQKILLNSSVNKESVNSNETLNIAFSGNKKLLPEDAISDIISSYDVYVDERSKSNKFRLIFNINPYCTNVLFNPFTEIIKEEGSQNTICLNFLNGYTNSNVIGKESGFLWNQYEAIRDTQLSNERCDFDYNCGIDIFNNHVLRGNGTKAVNYNEEKTNAEIYDLGEAYGGPYEEIPVNIEDKEEYAHKYINKDFNTIDDYMRDKEGVIISKDFSLIRTYTLATEIQVVRTYRLPLHLYQENEVLRFKSSVDENLLDDNGWYGFKNMSTMDTIGTISIDKDEQKNIETSLNINKVVNNKNHGDFIDMYPGRKLFSFTPNYNPYRKRAEKNWNYCLTYPSKSVVNHGNKNFPFFVIGDNGKTSLKALMVDDGVVGDDGVALFTVYSVCQHGLMEGDFVNIYKTYSNDKGITVTDLFYESSMVTNVIDKYTFQIEKTNGDISNYWIEVGSRYTNSDITGDDALVFDEENDKKLYELYGGNPEQKILNGTYVIRGNGNTGYYHICESNRCNIDPDAQNIHFRRVANNVECEYYVRKFSRLPNFKFKDEEVNDYTLYKEGSTLIRRFSKPGNENSIQKSRWPIEFENHIGKLGFSNTSYSDDVTEIVFTDDIDVSYLKDNLGRPLSDIYLTIVKNNRGYKKWYGKYGADVVVNDYSIEYSHCFGKNNSSFLLSDYFRERYINAEISNEQLWDVRDLTASNKQIKGLIYNNNSADGNEDEIDFDAEYEYYGDICCYSPSDCDEQSIQMSMNRFNTAQREIEHDDKSYKFFNGGVMYYDEIRDTENNFVYREDIGDPYVKFSGGTYNQAKESEVVEDYLYHTTREEFSGMTSFPEGYYYQPHYRIPIKTVSRNISSDAAIEYEIIEISKKSNDGVFEFKTSISNGFVKNERLTLYKKSTNQYYFVIVNDLINPYRFTCSIADESGKLINSIDGMLFIKNIGDYVLLKKHDGTPSYARLIKDGSCRYYWRNVISNGIENDKITYPFTNGVFYITKQINFFLRRQDPRGINLALSAVGGRYNFVPKGEKIENYINFNVDTNYNPEDIESC